MSLVNDMLRDLDRRRDAPTRTGIGAERLVPVADRQKNVPHRSLVSFILTVVISLLLITGAFYFWQRSNVPAVPAPVASTVPPSAAVSQQGSVAQLERVDVQEMALRMQELEAQNRALLEAQAAVDAQAAAVNAASPQVLLPVGEETAPVLPGDDSTVPTAAIAHASDLSPQEPLASEMPAPQPEVPPVTSAAAQATDVATLIRSPRAMSFAERDQLQAQDALRLVSSGQSDKAVRELNEFLGANPNAHQSREMSIKLALQRGDTPAAQTLLDTGLAMEPNRAGYRKLQARILLGNSQAAQAVTLLSNRPPSVLEDIEYHDLLATAYLSSQDYESAANTYEALVQRNRSEARWWYGLASAWDALGRKRDAALAYEQAVKLPSLSASLRQRSQQRIAEIGL